jgi:hypothetical protein
MLCVCGASCERCPHLYVECKTDCENLQGKVYWAKFIGADVCPVYQCVKDHGYTNCGDCEKLPCEIWFTLKDPSMTNEEHQQSIADRVKLLIGR